MRVHRNILGNPDRIIALENAVKELRRETAELRVHLAGTLQTAINDAKHDIQASIRVPKDGAPGRDGIDGKPGESIIGPQVLAGSITVIGDAELRAAVNVLRQKQIKWLAAIAHAREQNGQRPTSQRVLIEAILAKIEVDSR